MIIVKKAISRRTMLRSMSASIALPFLESMVPAVTPLRRTEGAPRIRFGAVYVPNGIIPSRWFPATDGRDFQLTPTLEPLRAFRDQLVAFSGLDSVPPPPPGENQINNHADASTRFLTDVTPGRVIRAGRSLDQVAAKVVGQETSLPSIELALESVDSATTCDGGRSCLYTGTISWADPTSPLPMEHDPGRVFERLFGDNDSTDPEARRGRLQQKGSILDSVLGEIAQLHRKVGPGDRSRLTAYLESIREVERRIQKTKDQNASVPTLDRPAGVPLEFKDYANLMFDLQVLAYQADVTRVITFMLGREFSGRTYPEIGVPDAHHPISHHQRVPVRVDKCAKINHYHVTLFSSYLEKLRATPDGDGSLLDHSIIMYGAGMNDGNGHIPFNIPVILVGGGAGRLQGGRHIISPKGTPLANLHTALLDKLGAPVESIGNSSGRIEL